MRRKKDVPIYPRVKSDPIEYVENTVKSKLNLSRNMKGSISNYSIPILDFNLLEIGEEIGRGSYSTVYFGKYRGKFEFPLIDLTTEENESSCEKGNSGKCEKCVVESEWIEGEKSGRNEKSKNEISGENKTSQAAVKIFSDNSGKKMVFRKKQAWKFSPEEEFNKQYRIFTRLKPHVNIAGIYGFFKNEKFGMILEYCDLGDLYNSLRNDQLDYQLSHFYSFVLDIAEGLKYLHNQNPPLIHRDIKSSNILLSGGNGKTGRLTAKIGDFGSSKFMDDSEPGLYMSTLLYNSPEFIQDPKLNSKGIDLYAFGIVMAELLIRIFEGSYHFPFYYQESLNMYQVLRYVTRGLLPSLPKSCPRNLSYLVNQLMSHNPRHRPSAETVSELMIKEISIRSINREKLDLRLKLPVLNASSLLGFKDSKARKIKLSPYGQGSESEKERNWEPNVDQNVEENVNLSASDPMISIMSRRPRSLSVTGTSLGKKENFQALIQCQNELDKWIQERKSDSSESDSSPKSQSRSSHKYSESDSSSSSDPQLFKYQESSTKDSTTKDSTTKTSATKHSTTLVNV